MECSVCGRFVSPTDREQVKAHARAHRLFGEASAAGREFEPHPARREAREKEAAAKLAAATADDARLAAMEALCRVAWEASLAAAAEEGTWARHPDLSAYAGAFERFDKDAALGPVWRKAHPKTQVPGLRGGWWIQPAGPAPAPERATSGGRLGAANHGLQFRSTRGSSGGGGSDNPRGGLDDLVGSAAPKAEGEEA